MWKKTAIFLFVIMLLFLKNLCFPADVVIVSDEKYIDPLESYEREFLEEIKDDIVVEQWIFGPQRIRSDNKIIFWGLDKSSGKKKRDGYEFSLKKSRLILFKKDLSTGEMSQFLIPGLGFRGRGRLPELYPSENGDSVTYLPLDSQNKVRILLTDNLDVFDVDVPNLDFEKPIGMRWSPKGEKLAFIGKEGISVFDISRKECLKVYNANYFSYPESFRWINDVQMLFVDEGFLYELELGKEPTQICSIPERLDSLHFSWSPDGSKIILGWLRLPLEYQVRLINLKENVTEELAHSEELPTGRTEYECGWLGSMWAPDSRKFVYLPAIMQIESPTSFTKRPTMLRLRILEDKKDIKLIDGEVRLIKWLDSNRLIYEKNGEKRLLTLKEQ